LDVTRKVTGMSILRDPLQHARSDYASARYPGDLAADILPVPSRGMRWFFPLLVGGAMAAAVAMMVLYRGPAPDAVSPARRSAPLVRNEGPKPTPFVYALPSRMLLTLPAAPLMPSTPPMTVSLISLQNDLGRLQQPYNEFGPRLMNNLRNFGRSAHPVPEKLPDAPAPATQGAA
jgi:hypothetical protein